MDAFQDAGVRSSKNLLSCESKENMDKNCENKPAQNSRN